ncbi:MAG: energy-coupling factor transporter transmembrane protein EcfT [Anaerolineae bacterium]|nr:energy-coupling factor transporter transmembrane protein EcfT [Anaerolineae bacterium]
MTVVFDTYIPGASFLHRLDPRAKLWATFLCLVLVFLLPNLLCQALFILAIHIILLAVDIPIGVLGRLWRQMAVLLVLILVLQPFFSPSGRLLVTLGPLWLTSGGILRAMELALRTAGMVFVTCALLLTTPQPALVRAFVKLGLPYAWGLTISLALRFLPAIQDLFHTVRDAQAARGWVAQGNLLKRFRDYIPVLVAVLISTLRMSDQLTLALAARGLESTHPRSSWRELQMAGSDWAFLACVTAAFGLLVIGSGFGF